MRFPIPALASLVALLSSTATLAAPPMLNPDAEVLQTGTCQADFGLGRIRIGASGQSAVHANAQQLGGACGLAPDLQLGVDYARTTVGHFGAEELGVNAKYRLALFGRTGPELSLLGGVSAARDEGSWHHGTGYLGLALPLNLGAHELSASLVRELPKGGGGHWRAGLGYGFHVNSEWTLLAEASDQKDERPRLGAGVRWEPASLKGWSFGAAAHREKLVETRGSTTAYLLSTRYRF